MQMVRQRCKMLFILFGLFFWPEVGYAIYPTLMYHDPMPLYTTRGVDVLPPQLSQQDDFVDRWFSWHVSVFHQQAKSSRNDRGIKVPVGDRLGRVNACGLFFNVHEEHLDKAVPAVPADTDPIKQYPDLVEAYNSLKAVTPVATNRYINEPLFRVDYNNDLNNNDGFMTVHSSFKKRGLRSVICIEPSKYFKFKIHAGCSEYSYSGSLVSLQDATDDGGKINEDLANQQDIMAIANKFESDFDLYKKNGFEDMFISAEGTYPVTFNGTDKEPAVTCYPFIGAGLWIPTGEKSDPNQFFSLSMGNEGFWGYGLNTGISIHFLEMLYFSFEAAFTFFNEKVVQMRYPTSSLQQGFFPFVGSVSRTPGMSWDLNVSLCGRHIIDGLSFYIDWIYAQHNNDKVALPISHNDAGEELIGQLNIPTIIEDPGTPTQQEINDRKSLSDQALVRLESLGFWKSEIFTVGFTYEITPAFELGLAFRGNLSGRNVTRTETILGTMKFAF